MKTKLLITIPLFLSATLFGTPSQKDNNTENSSLVRAKILKIFDSDGDGKLNDEERATVRKTFEKGKSEFFEKSDTNEEEIRDQAETKTNRTSNL